MNKIFTLLFLFLSSSLAAQNWEVLAEGVDYRIEESHVICVTTQGYDYDYMILKYTNLSNEEINLSFNFERWYNQEYCQGCVDGDQNTLRLITLPANSSIEGSCASVDDYLKIFDHAVTVNSNVWASKLTDVVINKIETTKN